MNHRLKHPTFVKTLLENPRYGAEIGVERGHFTEQMLAAFPHLHMIAVDPWQAVGDFADWPMDEIAAEFQQRLEPYQDRLTVLRLDSVTAAKEVNNGTLDFVFIDAAHDYENVLQDVRAWRLKVRPGGLLMGHDFSPKYPGVAQAVNQVLPDSWVDTYSSVWWVTC